MLHHTNKDNAVLLCSIEGSLLGGLDLGIANPFMYVKDVSAFGAVRPRS